MRLPSFALVSIGTVAAYAPPRNLAIAGSSFGSDYPIDALLAQLTTPWTILHAENATDADLAAATAFVEAPLDRLGGASAGKLYQFG